MELSRNPYSFDLTVNQNNQNFPSSTEMEFTGMESMEIEEWKALPPLPNELAAHIFSFLDVKTLYLLSQVSEKISRLALEALKLKLRLFGGEIFWNKYFKQQQEANYDQFLKNLSKFLRMEAFADKYIKYFKERRICKMTRTIYDDVPEWRINSMQRMIEDLMKINEKLYKQFECLDELRHLQKIFEPLCVDVPLMIHKEFFLRLCNYIGNPLADNEMFLERVASFVSENHEYLHGFVSDFDNIFNKGLKEQPQQDYVVRFSDSDPKCISFSYYDREKKCVKHTRINIDLKTGKFMAGGRIFESLKDVINCFKERLKLSKPIPGALHDTYRSLSDKS